MRISWRARFLNSLERPALKEKEKEYIEMVIEKDSIIREKNSHIKTVEQMMHKNEQRHVDDMKEVNSKLDIIMNAYEKQGDDLLTITEELLWQRNEATEWRERVEAKLELDKELRGISPPVNLKEIEDKRNDKKRSKEA